MEKCTMLSILGATKMVCMIPGMETARPAMNVISFTEYLTEILQVSLFFPYKEMAGKFNDYCIVVVE